MSTRKAAKNLWQKPGHLRQVKQIMRRQIRGDRICSVYSKDKSKSRRRQMRSPLLLKKLRVCWKRSSRRRGFTSCQRSIRLRTLQRRIDSQRGQRHLVTLPGVCEFFMFGFIFGVWSASLQ